MMPVRYLIVGPQRSGTTFIHLGLRGHPDVSSFYDEIAIENFFNKGTDVFVTGMGDVYTEKETENRYIKLFDFLANLEGKQDPLAVGLKCAISDSNQMETLVKSINEHFSFIRLIIIKRTNVIEQFISLERAKQHGYWHSTQQGQPPQDLKLNLNEDSFIRFFYNHTKVSEGLNILAKNCHSMVINYENDIEGAGKSVFEKIFKFLEVPTLEPSWVKMKKLNPVPENHLLNLDRIKDLNLQLENLNSDEIPLKFKKSFKKGSLLQSLKKKIVNR